MHLSLRLHHCCATDLLIEAVEIMMTSEVGKSMGKRVCIDSSELHFEVRLSLKPSV